MILKDYLKNLVEMAEEGSDWYSTKYLINQRPLYADFAIMTMFNPFIWLTTIKDYGDLVYDELLQSIGMNYCANSFNKSVQEKWVNILNITGEGYDGTLDLFIGNMCNILYDKFNRKRSLLYQAIVDELGFDPLTSYKETKTETPSITTNEDTTNSNTTTDSKTSNVDQSTNTDMNVTSNVTQEQSIFGFNSTEAVGSANSNASGTQNTEGSKETNTINTSGTSSSNSTTNGTKNRKLTREGVIETIKSGYKESPFDLLDKEVQYKLKYNLFDIMIKDVDSVLCLEVYE